MPLPVIAWLYLRPFVPRRTDYQGLWMNLWAGVEPFVQPGYFVEGEAVDAVGKRWVAAEQDKTDDFENNSDPDILIDIPILDLDTKHTRLEGLERGPLIVL